jgi:hypothetical protein
MPDTLSRRSFLGATAAAVAGGALTPGALAARPAAPAVVRSRAATFAAVSSSNGLPGVAVAVDMLLTGGCDTLDAGVEGVKIQELDPNDSLSRLRRSARTRRAWSSSMPRACTGRRKRAGAVGGPRGHQDPERESHGWSSSTPITSCWSARMRSGSRCRTAIASRSCSLPSRAMQWLRWRQPTAAPKDDWLECPRQRRSAGGPRPDRDDQHQRTINAERRHLIDHHDQRARVEDPRPRRRLADHRGGAVLRQPGRGRRLDRAGRAERSWSAAAS